MSEWQPDQAGLAEVLQLLASSQSASNETHRAIQRRLASFNACVPDFNNYLAHIFAHRADQQGAVRQASRPTFASVATAFATAVAPATVTCLPPFPPLLPTAPLSQMAGLVLKNNVRERWDELHPPVQAYVQQAVLSCIGAPEPFLRMTAGARQSTSFFCWGRLSLLALACHSPLLPSHTASRDISLAAVAVSLALLQRASRGADASRTAGSCVTSIAYAAGLPSWPDLVPTLLRALEPVPRGGGAL